jgi:iron complex transport system permease protein
VEKSYTIRRLKSTAKDKGKELKSTAKDNAIIIFFILSFLVALFFLLDLFLGSYYISIPDIVKSIFHPSDTGLQILTILRDFRVPKAVTAVLAGAALSVAGLQMQTVFRNPLAGPDILGVSSGASLGVALLVLGAGSLIGNEISSVAGSWSIVSAACIGSGAVLILIVLISARVSDILTILILGILFSSAILSIVNILQYFSTESMLKSFVIWTMGSLGSVTNSQLTVLLPSILAGLLITWLSSKFLDAFLLGENYARTMGMNVGFARIMIFISTCILAGSITAFCGPIGFIGIAVPHIARMLLQTARHRLLIPGTVLLGALVMLISDIISQLPGSESILPINSVTSMIGIPIVIWIILKNKNIGAL